ncbi:hypothetical protein J7643_16055 [bacterium]|nr:hypothetical protein [bacterium]
MKRSSSHIALAAALLVGTVPGCTNDPDEIAVLTPGPKDPGSSEVSGDVATDGGDTPLPASVQIPVETLELYRPPTAGQPASPSSAVVSAKVLRTDGRTDPGGVTWSVSDPSRLAVDAGKVSVLPGAAVGSAQVVAKAAANPAVFTRVFVTVKANPKALLNIAVSRKNASAPLGSDLTAVLYDADHRAVDAQSNVEINRLMAVTPGVGMTLLLMGNASELATCSVSVVANERQDITLSY